MATEARLTRDGSQMLHTISGMLQDQREARAAAPEVLQPALARPRLLKLDEIGLKWLSEINECAARSNSLRSQMAALSALLDSTEARMAARIDALRAAYGLQEGDRVEPDGTVVPKE